MQAPPAAVRHVAGQVDTDDTGTLEAEPKAMIETNIESGARRRPEADVMVVRACTEVREWHRAGLVPRSTAVTEAPVYP